QVQRIRDEIMQLEAVLEQQLRSLPADIKSTSGSLQDEIKQTIAKARSLNPGTIDGPAEHFERISERIDGVEALALAEAERVRKDYASMPTTILADLTSIPGEVDSIRVWVTKEVDALLAEARKMVE